MRRHKLSGIVSAVLVTTLFALAEIGCREDSEEMGVAVATHAESVTVDSIRLRIYGDDQLYSPTSLPLLSSGKDTIIDVAVPVIGQYWLHYGDGAMLFEVSDDTVYVSFSRDTLTLRGPLVSADTIGGNNPGLMVYDPDSALDSFRYSFTAHNGCHAIRVGYWNIWQPDKDQEFHYKYLRGEDTLEPAR